MHLPEHKWMFCNKWVVFWLDFFFVCFTSFESRSKFVFGIRIRILDPIEFGTKTNPDTNHCRKGSDLNAHNRGNLGLHSQLIDTGMISHCLCIPEKMTVQISLIRPFSCYCLKVSPMATTTIVIYCAFRFVFTYTKSIQLNYSEKWRFGYFMQKQQCIFNSEK
jgi:hypothetical protein